MAKISFSGLDTYMESLRKLGAEADRISGNAIYEGAKILADEIKSGIKQLDVGTESEYEIERREIQKEGLEKGFGVSVLKDDDGFMNVLIGFNGYNELKTPKFKDGQPNQMVARIFNSGTSHNRKQPFFDNAVKLTKKRVKLKMQETFEKEVEKIMKE